MFGYFAQCTSMWRTAAKESRVCHSLCRTRLRKLSRASFFSANFFMYVPDRRSHCTGDCTIGLEKINAASFRLTFHPWKKSHIHFGCPILFIFVSTKVPKRFTFGLCSVDMNIPWVFSQPALRLQFESTLSLLFRKLCTPNHKIWIDSIFDWCILQTQAELGGAQ